MGANARFQFLILLVTFWTHPARAVLTEADKKDIATRCFVWNEKFCKERQHQADVRLVQSIAKKAKPPEASRKITQNAWLLLFQAKDPVTALHRFNQAVILNGKNADAWRGAGTVYLQIGMYEAAEPLLKKAIEIDPKRADAHYSLGNWYVVARQDFQKAESAYRQAIRLNPTFGDAHSRLAQVVFIQGRAPEARELATRAKALGSVLDASFENQLNQKK